MPRIWNGATAGYGAVDLSPYKYVSFAFWLYWDAYANADDLALEYTSSTNANSGFYVDPDGATGSTWEVGFSNGTLLKAYRYSRVSFPAAAWNHVVVGIDRPGIAITVASNGVQLVETQIAGTLAADSTWANDLLYFFHRETGSTLFGAGRMAHLAVWGGQKLLVTGQARELYSGKSPLELYAPGTELLSYWPMDDYLPGGVSRNYARKKRSLLAGAGDIFSTAPSVKGGYFKEDGGIYLSGIYGVALGPTAPSIQTGFISATTVLYQPKTPVDLPVMPLIAATTVLYAFTVQVEVDRFPVFIAATTVVIAPKLAQPIVNVTVPQISGTPTQGLVLSCSTGTWTGTPPLTYTYQWRRCDAGGGACANISGATNTSYIVQAADVAGTLRCVVTASDQ